MKKYRVNPKMRYKIKFKRKKYEPGDIVEMSETTARKYHNGVLIEIEEEDNGESGDDGDSVDSEDSVE